MAAVDQILTEEEVDNGADETVQWTLTDHLNTVRDIARYDPAMDSTRIVNHLVYDAFGRATSESNPAVDSLFLFTARPFDSDSQLQNNLNRWYDPAVGRWLSEDPIGFAGADQNLYRYAINAPLTVSDSSGLRICGILVGGGFTFVAGGYIYIYSVCDHLGNQAVILVPRLAAGADVSIGAQSFVAAGTVPKFVRGQTIDVSAGVGPVGGQFGVTTGSGIGGGIGASVPWLPYWIFKLGITVGWSPEVYVIWKNF